MAKTEPLDTELAELPMALRWREWMARAEAVIFAANGPVTREVLARVVGRDCAIDLLVEDVANGLGDRPYEIVPVAGGWQMRSRSRFGAVIRAAHAPADTARALTPVEALVLAAIAYMQPVTRTQVSRMTGREVGRDTIARLHREALIARGPRSPEPGAPYTYVTTRDFLIRFGLASLRDLPDLEALQDAGLLQRETGLDFPLAESDGSEEE